VTHLPDGRVLSGGGDGKLCLWPRAALSTAGHTSSRPTTATTTPASITSTCLDLDGHASAVSKVAAVPASARLAFSAGYDGAVRE
jgi:WD40 repeat protein